MRHYIVGLYFKSYQHKFASLPSLCRRVRNALVYKKSRAKMKRNRPGRKRMKRKRAKKKKKKKKSRRKKKKTLVNDLPGLKPNLNPNPSKNGQIFN